MRRTQERVSFVHDGCQQKIIELLDEANGEQSYVLSCVVWLFLIAGIAPMLLSLFCSAFIFKEMRALFTKWLESIHFGRSAIGMSPLWWRHSCRLGQ
jgi:hypothetical protein